MNILKEAKKHLKDIYADEMNSSEGYVEDLITELESKNKEIERYAARIQRASSMMKTGDYSITTDELMDGFLTDVAQTIDACNRLDKQQKEIERYEAVTEAAKFLIKVKRHKDTKTALYLASWPIALRKIEEALAGLKENNGE